jgi:hypothetical protein
MTLKIKFNLIPVRYSVFYLFFLLTSLRTHASHYVIIKPGFGKVGLIHVDPPKHLKKWTYDKQTDTYYSKVGLFGAHHRLGHTKDHTQKSFPLNEAQFIVIKSGFIRIRLIHVDKPSHMKKWVYDTKSGTYYCLVGPLGTHYRVRLTKDFTNPIK